MDQVLISWLLLLGIGFPLIGLILNEAAERLEQPQPQLATALRKVLQYVLPSLAILLVMQRLLNIAETENSSRLVETITWVAIVVAGVALANAIFTTTEPPKGFQLRVPNLFFQVMRAAVVLGVAYRILGGIWQIDLSGLATAAGVGSLVIALALQDTLSNLVSGFLMLLSRPFNEGDYIEFGDVKGVVVDQNWRSVTLKEKGLEKYITVPNGTLAQATIDNFGNIDTEGKWHSVTCGFSYDDPPFKVLSLLSRLGNGIEHELTFPKIYPVIDAYEESKITYKIWYKKSPGSSKRHPDSRQNSVSTMLYSRIYYLAKREGLTIPYPISVSYDVDAAAGIPNHIPNQVLDNRTEINAFLRSLPYFSSLSEQELASLAGVATLKAYGLGEIIAQEGYVDDGLYVVYSGSVWSSTRDHQGHSQDLNAISEGELFGEMALFPGEVSPITVVAREDSQLVVLPAEALRQLIQGNAQASGNSIFASEILTFIDERKKVVQSLKTAGKNPVDLNAKHHGEAFSVNQY